MRKRKRVFCGAAERRHLGGRVSSHRFEGKGVEKGEKKKNPGGDKRHMLCCELSSTC